MENVADALKLAYGVLIFVVAVSLSVSTFSKARQSIESIITNRDKTQDYVYVEKSNVSNRIVGIETIVESMYKAYRENYKIVFLKKENGQEKELVLYRTQETQYTSEWTDINYIDLEDEKFANLDKAIEHLEELLTKNNLNKFTRKNATGTKTLYQEQIGDIGGNGLYKFLQNKQFEERIGEFYQEDSDAGKETDALEINKTKKRVITYIML